MEKADLPAISLEGKEYTFNPNFYRPDYHRIMVKRAGIKSKSYYPQLAPKGGRELPRITFLEEETRYKTASEAVEKAEYLLESAIAQYRLAITLMSQGQPKENKNESSVHQPAEPSTD